MPLVVSYEAAKAQQLKREHDVQTPFMDFPADTPDLPSAFLSEGILGKVIRPHWHSVDQFQVITEGHGKLGRKEVGPYSVQFVRAYTPYGPIVDDGKTPLSFLALRARFDPWAPGTTSGAQYLPETMDRLKHVTERRPWQITRQIQFPASSSGPTSGIDLQEVPDIKDEAGLFTYSLAMAPNTETAAPDPTRGDGQYLLIVKGSLWYEHQEHKALTIVFIKPQEGPFLLRAGAEGLAAIIMNFPQPATHTPAQNATRTTAGYRKWQCELCAFAYDEAAGLPGDGIAAGTRWEDVPENWTCPDCSSAKSDFRMVEVP